MPEEEMNEEHGFEGKHVKLKALHVSVLFYLMASAPVQFYSWNDTNLLFLSVNENNESFVIE